jgi:hypothetical protein
MKAIVIAGVALAMSVGVNVHAGDEPAAVSIPPTDVTVKVQAPQGTSEADIAAAIAAENARRDPAAQQAAQVAKRKADQDEAHTARVSKICDSIPEQAMANDPSLRRMCQ